MGTNGIYSHRSSAQQDESYFQRGLGSGTTDDDGAAPRPGDPGSGTTYADGAAPRPGDPGSGTTYADGAAPRPDEGLRQFSPDDLRASRGEISVQQQGSFVVLPGGVQRRRGPLSSMGQQPSWQQQLIRAAWAKQQGSTTSLSSTGRQQPVAQTTVQVSPPGSSGNEPDPFNIEIKYPNGINPIYVPYIQAAVKEWEDKIAEGLPSHEGVDDLQISVQVTDMIKGVPGRKLTVAQTYLINQSKGITFDYKFRPDLNQLPYSANIIASIARYSPEKMADPTISKDFQETITHEIGHALGITSKFDRWESLKMPGNTRQYTGTNALEFYRRSKPENESASFVPMINESHWAVPDLMDETGSTTSDGLTLAALSDLGYKFVNPPLPVPSMNT